MTRSIMPTLCLMLVLALSNFFMADAFVVGPSASSSSLVQRSLVSSSARPVQTLHASPLDMMPMLDTTVSSSSSLTTAAATLDPTTLLSNILGAFLNSDLILAVPIVAALGVATLLAWGIVAYASPVVEDE